MAGRLYTNMEDGIIRKWYAKEGLPGAVVKLKMNGYIRTANSVRRRASILKVKSPYCMANITPSLPAKHYTWSPRWETNYQQVCDYLKQGLTVSDSCRLAGIERGMFYKIRKIKEGK